MLRRGVVLFWFLEIFVGNIVKILFAFNGLIFWFKFKYPKKWNPSDFHFQKRKKQTYFDPNELQISKRQCFEAEKQLTRARDKS